MSNITEKQKCIAEQAIYGDLVISNHGQLTEMERRCGVNLEPLPVLRPLSVLTKEITHKGYNDDKPFVPIVKMFEFFTGLYLTEQNKQDFEIFFNDSSDGCEHDPDAWSVVIYNDIKLEINERGTPCVFCYDDNRTCWKPSFIAVSQSYYDLLNLWHFDTRNLITTGEAIDVNTITKNSYEV